MNQAVERIRMALKYAINVGPSAVPINPYVLAAVLTHIDDQAAEIDRIKAQQERKPHTEAEVQEILGLWNKLCDREKEVRRILGVPAP